MKLIHKAILLFFTIFLISVYSETYASHAMGADLTYDCIGPNTYRVRYTFYRDCAGIAAPTTATVRYSSITCGINLNLTVNLVPGSATEVSPLCPSYIGLSRCNGGTLPGVQAYIYEGVVTLPAYCTDWVFSVSINARNAALNTISTPGSQNLYVEANLNNISTLCNSNPIYTTIPVPYICLGQPYTFNVGAIDADGDSLYYELTPALTAAGTPVPYINPPYSYLNPISSSTPIYLDPLNGTLTFTPNALQSAVVAIKVYEYRGGVLVGTSTRDIQLTVIACTNDAPTLSGVTGLVGGTLVDSNTVSVCAGSTISFIVIGTDINIVDSVSFLSNVLLSLPGSTYTVRGNRIDNIDTVLITWTAGASNIGVNTFTISVRDNACPIFGQNIRAYNIIVAGVQITSGDTMIRCIGSTLPTVLTAEGSLTTYTWSVLSGDASSLTCTTCNPNSVVPNTTTSYRVLGTSSLGCPFDDTVIVSIIPTFDVFSINDTSICFGDSVFLYTNSNDSARTTYFWQSNPTLTNIFSSSPVSRPIAGTYTYVVTGDNGACIDYDTVRVSVRGAYPNITIIADTVPVCPGTIVPMTAQTIPGDCNNMYTISNIPFAPVTGSGTAVTLTDNQITGFIPLGFTFPFFCGTHDSIRISSNGFLSFNRLSTDGCCSGQILPNAAQPNGVIAGCWTNLNPSLPGNSIDYRTIGTAPNRQFIVNFNDVPIRDFFNVRTGTCKQQYVLNESTGIIDIHTTQVTGMTSYLATMGIENMTGTSALTVAGRNNGRWTDSLVSRRWDPTLPVFTYSWSPSAGLSDLDSSYTEATVGPSRTYQVQVSDNGCSRFATHVTLEDTTLRITSFPANDTLCSPDTVQLCATVVYDSLNRSFPYCDRYTVASIPYNLISGSGTAVALSDDQLSAALPIGFNFNFFCQSKSQFKISSNGFITFDVASTNSGCCTGQLLPNGFAPNDLIAAAWEDLDPNLGSAGTIDYYTTGTAPNRILIVNFNDVSHFNAPPTIDPVKFQIRLYETTNIIEIHTTYMNGNPTGFWGAHTMGIENNNGTSAYAVTGRNSNNTWTATNDGIRFAPDSFIIPPRILDFDWTPTTGLSDSNSLCPNAYVNQTTTYILHVTDGVCDKYDTVTIIVDSLPYTISNDTAICYGRSVNLSATATNNATYVWSPSATLAPSSTIANPTATPLVNTTYNLTITDTLGCSKTDSVSIIVHPKIPITLTPASTFVCTGDSVIYDATNPAFTSYQWNPSGTNSTYTATATGNYSVIATDSFGCKDTSNTVYLRVVPIPAPNITATDDSFCTGNSVVLSYTGSTGTSTNIWSPTGGSGVNNTVSVAGTYIITVTDSGCIGADSFTVWEKFPPILDPLNDTTMCCGQTKSISAYSEAGASYSWSTPSGTSTINPLETIENGVYSVTVTRANGCTATESMTFSTVCLDAIASASPDSQFVNDISILTVGTASGYSVSYNWSPSTYLNDNTIQSPSASSTTASPNQLLYTVIVTDTVSGCKDTATVTLHIKELGFFALPNAFTPNGDGLNDQFYPVLTVGATVQEFRVFDRWGNIVYDSPLSPGWDGNFLGTAQPIGSYVYYTRIQYPDPADASRMLEQISNGAFTLIR
jgi:gliding motility-associated-like protein